MEEARPTGEQQPYLERRGGRRGVYERDRVPHSKPVALPNPEPALATERVPAEGREPLRARRRSEGRPVGLRRGLDEDLVLVRHCPDPPAPPRVDVPHDFALLRHHLDELALVMDADHADILLHGGGDQDPPTASARCQAEPWLPVEAVALDPEPALWEASAPVLLAVGRRRLELVALVAPLEPSRCLAVSHEDLPVRLEDRERREPPSGGHLLPAGVAPAAPRLDGEGPARPADRGTQIARGAPVLRLDAPLMEGRPCLEPELHAPIKLLRIDKPAGRALSLTRDEKAPSSISDAEAQKHETDLL
eukprot:CAMPEP_0177596700 /NCGR_PEP_ID=MMETSP0419_2-20121207/11266_1 /TAXON_ID=582737 /ORGANISM="Tetraselmis sp., Strain GSL018" /LENGTH=305 /DNA_ID=CAMNT_0019088717 /DNA_START=980 /DNA_END=1899 /DNA_ORIENTATION=+